MSPAQGTGADAAFRHEALFYSGEDEFLSATVPFLREAVGRDEPAMVAVGTAKAQALRAQLGRQARHVAFVDMERLGRNPARIIPAWRDFVAEHGADGRPLRGIGEPAWAGRSDDEYAECDRHESLLNLAFADAGPFRLMCPYDAGALPDDVLEAARRNHPLLARRGAVGRSTFYLAPERRSPFQGSLPPPAGEVEELRFGPGQLRAARGFASQRARAAGLDEPARGDFVLVADELVTNSVRHGGGGGVLRIWRAPGAIVCEVRDRGTIDEPLVGRDRPACDQPAGRGLWIVNQVCDLVQIRSLPGGGNVIRARLAI